jgi:hypothetical protein
VGGHYLRRWSPVNWKPAATISALVRTPQRIALTVVAGGIAARCYLFLLNRSFWIDEAKLALNVVQRSFGELLGPLDLDQAAPPGFLVISKAMIAIFGNSDIVLRIFPLVGGCAALYLMYRLSFTVLPSPAALLAVILFALGKFVLYFSTDFKQYSDDVAIALLLTLATIRFLHGSPSKTDLFVLGVTGILALQCSFPAVFVLGGAGLSLVLHFWKSGETRTLATVLLIAGAWAAVFITMTVLMFDRASGNPGLQSYWSDSFMPLPPWRRPLWLPTHLAALFVNPVGLLDVGPTTGIFCGLLFLTGAVSLFRRWWQVGVLFFVPLALALAASALHRYPFSDRLMLWSVPALILAVVEGVRWFSGALRNIPRLQRFATAVLVAVLVAGPVRAAGGDILRPKARQHIKPLLAYLRSSQTSGDLLYVYHKSRNPFLYYYPMYGLSPAQFVIGGNFNGETDRYVDEITSLGRSHRVWILFSYVSPGGAAERDHILERLGKLGSVVEEKRERSASLCLFEPSTNLNQGL